MEVIALFPNKWSNYGTTSWLSGNTMKTSFLFIRVGYSQFNEIWIRCVPKFFRLYKKIKFSEFQVERIILTFAVTRLKVFYRPHTHEGFKFTIPGEIRLNMVVDIIWHKKSYYSTTFIWEPIDFFWGGGEGVLHNTPLSFPKMQINIIVGII